MQTELVHTAGLAQARAEVATVVLGEPEGIAAALSIVEAVVHRGRLAHRALLLQRPIPTWVEPHIRTVHAQAGCQRRRLPHPSTAQSELALPLARLPWSGEWLIRVLATFPASAAARARPLAALWVERRNAFVEEHVKLVTYVVRRSAATAHIPREDLIQEGVVALCRAVERYDPSRGTGFSSYAIPVIRHAITNALRRMGEGPKVPRQQTPVVVTTGLPRLRGSSTPSRKRRTAPSLLSLDSIIEASEEPVTLAEHLTDPEAPALDAAVIQRIEREQLRRAFATLPSEVQHILTVRWGLDGASPRSLGEVARRVGKSHEEIGGLIARSLRILRHRLEAIARPEAVPIAPAASAAEPSFPATWATDHLGPGRRVQTSTADPKEP